MLFENRGGEYKNVSGRSGDIFGEKHAARGLAAGDYDNDGDLDILVSNNGGPPLLLNNRGGNGKRWVGLRLIATAGNPEAVGAVIVWKAGGKVRRRLRTGGGSFLSSHDPREILGLGASPAADEIAIHWPSGTVDRLAAVDANAYITVKEGAGIVQ